MNLIQYRYTVLLFSSLLLAACATTYVTDSWKDETYKAPVNKVLVIGMTADMSRRKIFEQTIVSKFIAEGKEAVVSFEAFNDGGSITKELLTPYIQQNAIDSVLVTRLVDTKKTKIWASKSGSSRTMPNQYNNLFMYHDPSYGVAYDAARTKEDVVLFLESNLYETKAAKIIWSMSSRSHNPKDLEKDVKEFSKLIIKNLGKKGLL